MPSTLPSGQSFSSRFRFAPPPQPMSSSFMSERHLQCDNPHFESGVWQKFIMARAKRPFIPDGTANFSSHFFKKNTSVISVV